MTAEVGSFDRIITIAKKDFRDASQSRALWALVSIFVLITAMSAYIFVDAPELLGGAAEPNFEGLLFFTAAGTALFVPIAAIIICYKSVAGERELGSMKVLLSQPATRRDVFIGKVIGRALVLSTAVGIGVLIGLVFGSLLLGSFHPFAALVFLVATLFYVLTYTSIMVCLSAITGSTVRATTYALGFFVIFEILWDVIPLGLVYVVEGFQLPAEPPEWFITIAMISPATAYFSAVNALLPVLDGGVADEPDAPAAGAELGLNYADAFYASPEMGILFMLAWLILPLGIGYYVFNKADI